MKDEIKLKTDCKTCRTHLADLLLDESYVAQHPELAAHLEGCAACRTELAELQATFAMLDEWAAPEPSPYFDSKMHVLLREAEAARPEGFWERTRSFLLFSTGRRLRPVMASVLAVTLLAGGGGTFLGVYHSGPTALSPTVNDLRILDNNAQALQQMDQLLDDGSSSSDDGSAPPTT